MDGRSPLTVAGAARVTIAGLNGLTLDPCSLLLPIGEPILQTVIPPVAHPVNDGEYYVVQNLVTETPQYANYQANCHGDAIHLEIVRAEPIANLIDCNCSICQKKNPECPCGDQRI